MDILEQFKHVETFELMSYGDKLLATGYVILLGMFVTFVGLVLIMYLTMLMSKVLMTFENRSKKTEPAKVSVAKSEAVPVVVDEKQEDDELVAIITAAIAASLNTSMHNIVVSSIKRVPDATPVWGQSGRGEVMAARIK